MKCATVKEWMPHYIDGLLSPELELAISLHIQSCPGCALWLEEAREMAALWAEMDAEREQDFVMEGPDLVSDVMAHIGQLESGRRERTVKATRERTRSTPKTSWVHYGLAACLTFILLQFGVFEDLAYGITEINGHMSNSVTSWFGPQGKD